MKKYKKAKTDNRKLSCFVTKFLKKLIDEMRKEGI